MAEVENRGKQEKWKSLKLNMEAYVLLRKLSLTLGLRQYYVVYIALALLYFLLIGDIEKARQIIIKMKDRMERMEWAVENIMRTLNDVLER